MNRSALWILLFIVFSLAVVAVAPMIGGDFLSVKDVLFAAEDSTAPMLFWKIRMPRVCLGWVAGAALAVAGMVFQAMFRNALATPFTLGVSSGASLGAAIGIHVGLGFSFWVFTGTSFASMFGALGAIGIVYGVTRMKKDFSTGAMLLTGVAVNFFFSSLILLIQYQSSYTNAFRILRWLMGGLDMVGFDATLGLLPFVLIGFIAVALMVGELNLLTIGEELAASRGVAVERLKMVLFFCVSIMVGAVVATCGPIGFVGLMCPHICRLIVGADHRALFPATVFFGGAFLVICDTVARSLFFPTELPVGIFTSFLGGPFFLWLLVKPPKGGRIVG
ncbi:MAG: FecCD family ABC transporter permease [Candidatus Sumerlaeota bacterium]